MIIAGVDLGVRKAAVAIIDEEDPDHKRAATHSAHAFMSKSHNRQEQLLEIAEWVRTLTRAHGVQVVYVEEPLIGRNTRVSLQIAQTVGAVMARLGAHGYLVDNNSWKKLVVGKGRVEKDSISSWLEEVHPCYSANCDGDQDKVDATCIALYGVQQQSTRKLLFEQ